MSAAAAGHILVPPNYVLSSIGTYAIRTCQPISDRLPDGSIPPPSCSPSIASGTSGATPRSARIVNLDAALVRTFHPVERVALQFRAEFFNLANHPNYNLVGRIVNDPTFGIVQNQLPPRQIQFGLKVAF